MMRSLVRGDFDAYERKMQDFTERGAWNGYSAFLAAAFFMAVERRFRPGEDPASIIRLVAEAREQFDESGRDIDPVDAENLVWSVLDDRDVSGIEGSAVAKIETVLLHKLLTDEDLSDEQLDELLIRAEQAGARWSAETQST
jgi:hypothetical protein